MYVCIHVCVYVGVAGSFVGESWPLCVYLASMLQACAIWSEGNRSVTIEVHNDSIVCILNPPSLLAACAYMYLHYTHTVHVSALYTYSAITCICNVMYRHSWIYVCSMYNTVCYNSIMSASLAFAQCWYSTHIVVSVWSNLSHVCLSVFPSE